MVKKKYRTIYYRFICSFAVLLLLSCTLANEVQQGVKKSASDIAGLKEFFFNDQSDEALNYSQKRRPLGNPLVNQLEKNSPKSDELDFSASRVPNPYDKYDPPSTFGVDRKFNREYIGKAKTAGSDLGDVLPSSSGLSDNRSGLGAFGVSRNRYVRKFEPMSFEHSDHDLAVVSEDVEELESFVKHFVGQKGYQEVIELAQVDAPKNKRFNQSSFPLDEYKPESSQGKNTLEHVDRGGVVRVDQIDDIDNTNNAVILNADERSHEKQDDLLAKDHFGFPKLNAVPENPEQLSDIEASELLIQEMIDIRDEAVAKKTTLSAEPVEPISELVEPLPLVSEEKSKTDASAEPIELQERIEKVDEVIPSYAPLSTEVSQEPTSEELRIIVTDSEEQSGSVPNALLPIVITDTNDDVSDQLLNPLHTDDEMVEEKVTPDYSDAENELTVEPVEIIHSEAPVPMPYQEHLVEKEVRVLPVPVVTVPQRTIYHEKNLHAPKDGVTLRGYLSPSRYRERRRVNR